MNTYIVLLRGINFGGRNKIPMSALRLCLEQAGFTDVMTYIQSGNVILRSSLSQEQTAEVIEKLLPENFLLDSPIVKTLVLSTALLRATFDNKPAGFGDQPDKYHSDAIFLIGIDVAEAMKVFTPREGVDVVSPGEGVIYSQRLSAERTKSRLNRIIGTIPYQSMTVRNWNTVMRLLQLAQNYED